MPALDMPAAVQDVPAQQLIPGDVIDVLDRSWVVDEVIIRLLPQAQVWVRISAEHGSGSAWQAYEFGQSVICTRRAA